MEATSSDERKDWLDMLNSFTKGKEEGDGGGSSEPENDFDLTGLDPKLGDFFKQLWFVGVCFVFVLCLHLFLTPKKNCITRFEITYPKSSLVINEVFRIRIIVTDIKTKHAVADHRVRCW